MNGNLNNINHHIYLYNSKKFLKNMNLKKDMTKLWWP